MIIVTNAVNQLQKPVKVSLGVNLKPDGRGAKSRLVEKHDWLVYVPLLDTLSVLLNKRTIMAEVQSYILLLYSSRLEEIICEHVLATTVCMSLADRMWT